MKKVFSIFAKFAILFAIFANFAIMAAGVASADSTIFTSQGDNKENIRIWDTVQGTVKGTAAEGVASFWGHFSDFFFSGGDGSTNIGEKGAYNLIITIARDVKNVFMLIAVVYLIIASLKLLFAKGGDDDMKKWKMSFIWTAVGIVVMQIAFVFIITLYDQAINGYSANKFLDNIIYPFIKLLEVLASFAFIATAVYSFFLMATAWGNEENVKKGRSGIINALLGYALIKIPTVLVRSIYGEARCETGIVFGTCRITDPNLGETVWIMTTIVNYINGFLAIVTVLLIIYAGFLMVTSGGDEEKSKKAKHMITYIVIGFLLLMSSYILFNFFVDATAK